MALTRPLTLDEFLLQLEEQPALEYERGVVTQKMSPQPKHGKLQMTLAMRFERHGYPQQVVSAFPETRVIWPAEGVSYVPDVIAYLPERVPYDEHGEIADHLYVPPDVTVEIPSPEQGLERQLERCRWYVAHGVAVSLLVHPGRHAVWVFRPGSESGPLEGDAVVDLSPEISGFSFVVSELFAVLRRPPQQ
ncbi:MAG: Uma2 family endonuclease [Chloroflexota bacterium]